MEYKNKKVFILGMARSGYEVAKLLSSNCEIVITDKKNDEDKVRELTELGVKCVITDDQASLLDETFDVVVKNPGIPTDSEPCLKAISLNIPIVNEVEVAYSFLDDIKIIGITGSNGKTTTTTLIYELLKKANLPVHLGGNIGTPLSALVSNIKKNDILVIELSAQQLHDFKDFKVDIAVLTNLVPVHLDFFKTFDFYKECKKRIFKNCELAIINELNEDCNIMSKEIDSKLMFNSSKKSDLYVADFIYYKNEAIISIKDIKLKGIHNYENIMCMIAVAKQFDIDNQLIFDLLNEFNGVEHRIEFVKKINSVSFYNDSKSTNVTSTITALKAFTEPTILLLGGLDRGHSFDELTEYMKNVKCVVCYGETRERIFDFCNKISIPCYVTENLEEAVIRSMKYANDGDVILLSPACASWDQYDSYEKRGNDYKNIIEKLV